VPFCYLFPFQFSLIWMSFKFSCYKLPCLGTQPGPWIPTPGCCTWRYWCTLCKMVGQYQHKRGGMPGFLKLWVQCLLVFIFYVQNWLLFSTRAFLCKKITKCFHQPLTGTILIGQLEGHRWISLCRYAASLILHCSYVVLGFSRTYVHLLWSCSLLSVHWKM